MKFGISNLSIIPVRKQSSEQSEMVTQLLFGDLYEVIEIQDKWVFIKQTFDGYEGWIDRKMAEIISESEFRKINSSSQYFISTLTGSIIGNNGNLNLVFGSSLPNFDGSKLGWDNTKYQLENSLGSSKLLPIDNLISISKLYLNTPYLWGGRSPFGIDCSGYTQMIFKVIGVSLPRDAYQQAELGIAQSVESSSIGDLAFFKNAEGKIIHVGLIIDNNQIIHASGKVRIDKLDKTGIYKTELNNYSHFLHSIKRIIS